MRGQPVEAQNRADAAHAGAGRSERRARPAGGYRPWAELLARTFAVDVLACPKCHGRMRMGEPTELPRRSPGRGPPYWNSRVLRRQALGEEGDGLGRWVQGPHPQADARESPERRGKRLGAP